MDQGRCGVVMGIGMPTTENNIRADVKSLLARDDAQNYRETLVHLLKQQGVTDCFIDLSGKQSHVDHREIENQHPLDNIVGNYGVMAVGKLGFVDIDVPELDDLPENVQEFVDRHDTLTVRTTHDGLHLYFIVNGEATNSQETWGEIRVDNQYVVGPGSKIDHAQCADCGEAGVGEYRIENAVPIQQVDAAELDDLSTAKESKHTTIDVDDVESSLSEAPRSRIARAQNIDPKFQQLFLWASGHATLERLPYDDRSSAEVALCQKLLFYLEWDVEAVKETMNTVKPPKWSHRGEDYRQSVIQAGLKYTEKVGAKFDTDYTKDGGIRLAYAKEITFIVGNFTNGLADSVKMSEVLNQLTANLTQRPELKDSISRYHALKVFNALEEEGYLHKEGCGPATRWVVDELPDSQADLWDRFPTSDEIRKQQKEYLRRNSMMELDRKP